MMPNKIMKIVTHKIECGFCQDDTQIQCQDDYSATSKEIDNIVEYYGVCVDCRKRGLDGEGECPDLKIFHCFK